MKKNIYFKNLATCLLIAWFLSRGGPAFAQTEYPSTYLHFNTEVGCQEYTFFREMRMEVMEEQGVCYQFCSGSIVDYTIEGAEGSTFSWNVEGGTAQTLTTNSFRVTWGATGSGAIAITETTVSNISSTSTVCVEIIERPTAKFRVPPYEVGEMITVCKNEEIYFADLSGYDNSEIVSWHWDFGDGTSSAEQHPTHSWDQSGVYVVKLTVTNACNCTDEFEVKLNVKDGQAINIICPAMVCEKHLATYKVEDHYCNSYQWSIIGGKIISGASSPQVDVLWNNPSNNPLIDGFGFLTFDTEDCSATCGGATTIKVPVIMDVSSIEGEAVVCENEQYYYSLPGWPATLYEWDVEVISGNVTSTFIGPQKGKDVVLSFQGDGVVRLHAEYTNTVIFCDGLAHFDITVQENTHIEGHDPVVCVASTDTFVWKRNNTILSGNWKLKSPNGTTITHTGASFSPSFPLEGHYLLSVSSPLECPLEPISIYAKALPNLPAQIEGDTIVCVLEPITYSADTVTAGTICEWEIEGGMLANTTGAHVTVQWLESGTLYMYRTAIETPHCRELIDSLIVTIFNDDHLQITPVSSHPNYANCSHGFEVRYNGEPYTEAISYEWAIEPFEVASVVDNPFDYNPIVQNKHVPTATNAMIILVYNICGERSKSKNFIISPVPDPIIVVSDATPCPNETVSITISNSDLFDQANRKIIVNNEPTSFIGATTSYAFNNSQSSPQPTQFTVQVEKCEASYHSAQSVTVQTVPNVIIQPASNLSLCPPISEPLQITTSPANNNYEYSWYKNNQLIPDANTTIFTATDIGSYYATVTNVQGCTQKSKTITIDTAFCIDAEGLVTDLCPIEITTTQNCETVDASVAYLNNNQTIQHVEWHPTPSNSEDNGSTAQYHFNEVGYHIIRAEATSNTGCVSTHLDTIFIPIIPTVSISFDCVDNQHRTILENESSVHHSVNNYEYAFIVDDYTVYDSFTEYLSLPAGTTHTIRIRTIYQGDTCLSAPLTFTVPSLTALFTVTNNPTCEGNPVVFTPQQADNVLEYTWVFPEAYTLKTYIGEHNFLYREYYSQNPQPLNTSLTLTDYYGCTQTTTQDVHVWKNSVDGIIDPPFKTVCEGVELELTAQFYDWADSTAPVIFEWRDSLGFNQHAYPVVSGGYSVGVTNGRGCFKVFKEANIEMIPIPKPLIMGKRVVCEGDDIQLSGYYGEEYQYMWQKIENETVVFSQPTSTLTDTATEVGNYTYQLTITPNDTTCSSTTTVTVTVHSIPAPPVISVQGSSCNPYSIALTSNLPPNNNSIYRWSNGRSGHTISVNRGGPYRLYYTNEYGCEVSSNSITLPESPEFYFWTFPTGCYSLCEYPAPYYVHGPTFFPNNQDWTWKWRRSGIDLNGGTTPSTYNLGLSPPLAITTTGAYQMYLSNDFCPKVSPEMEVQFIECHQCSAYLEVPQGITVCYNSDGVAEFTLNVNGFNQSNWNYCLQSMNNFLIFPSAGQLHTGNNALPIALHTDAATSSDELLLTIWSPYNEDNKCEFTVKIILHPCSSNSPGIQMSPSMEENTESVKQEKVSISLYPNPASQQCHITYQLIEEGKYSLTLRDLNGKEMITEALYNLQGTHTFNIAHLQRGTYTIECRHNGTLLQVLKLIKQ